MQLYLTKLAPDGMLVLHVSNRNLKLAPPVAAALRDAGVQVLHGRFKQPDESRILDASSSEVLVAARSPEVLAALRGRPGWTEPPADDTRAWTDDHVDLVGAVVGAMRD